MLRYVFPFLGAKRKTPQQVLSEHWSERIQVQSSNINLFCWRRPEVPDITQYLDGLIQEGLPNVRASVNSISLEEDLATARKIWDPANKSNADAFWSDIGRIANDFLGMSAEGTGILHLRLVENNACTKFHLDGYDLRLFTTYFGPGTEWLPETAVNRSALGKSNELIVKDPGLVQQMRAFEVGILKGEIPGKINHTPGIVHRSPAIEGNEQKRIIMRIDI